MELDTEPPIAEMSLSTRIRGAVGSPARLPGAVWLVGTKLYRLLRDGRLQQAAAYLGEFVLGENVYYRRVRDAPEGHVVVDIHDHRMWLDTTDPGISRTLLTYGFHEYASTRAFRRELRRVAEEADRPIALDIGSNIGYFCLLEASTLGGASHVYAVEPTPENADTLERNVRLNGFEDRITVERCAIGDRFGETPLYRSGLSNQHSVRPTDGADRRLDDDSITVPMRTVGDLLDEHGVAPDAVNVLRMDLEGYESVVLADAEPVLAGPGPTVVHVELHPIHLSAAECREIVDRFREHDFGVASLVVHETAAGLNDRKSWHGKRLDADDLDDVERTLLDVGHAVELIVAK
jgi:FkbM family methyltransferase